MVYLLLTALQTKKTIISYIILAKNSQTYKSSKNLIKQISRLQTLLATNGPDLVLFPNETEFAKFVKSS